MPPRSTGNVPHIETFSPVVKPPSTIHIPITSLISHANNDQGVDFSDAHILPTLTDITVALWYHWGCDRSTAEDILKTAAHGSFIVRQQDEQSTLVLVVKWGSGFKHYKIYYVQDKGFTMGGDCVLFFEDSVYPIINLIISCDFININNV